MDGRLKHGKQHCKCLSVGCHGRSSRAVGAKRRNHRPSPHRRRSRSIRHFRTVANAVDKNAVDNELYGAHRSLFSGISVGAVVTDLAENAGLEGATACWGLVGKPKYYQPLQDRFLAKLGLFDEGKARLQWNSDSESSWNKFSDAVAGGGSKNAGGVAGRGAVQAVPPAGNGLVGGFAIGWANPFAFF